MRSCSAQPRKVSSVPDVSLAAMTAAVARSLCVAKLAATVASAASGRTSSPIQLLIAEGVMESARANRRLRARG